MRKTGLAAGRSNSIGTPIADLALVARICLRAKPSKQTAMAGGLISLGADLLAMTGPVAAQIDRIIKGASPADIPVERPTRRLPDY